LNPPKLGIHKATVCDTAWNPFVHNILASGAEDCLVKITKIPGQLGAAMGQNVDASDATMDGHSKKVALVRWNPVASNVLASLSYDNDVKIWDVEAQAQKHATTFTDTLFSMAWNRDGSQLAVSSKDKKLTIYDPRNEKSSQVAPSYDSGKHAEVVWLDNHGLLATFGFSKTAYRQYSIYDPRKFNEILKTVDIDTGSGILVPHYDPDNSVLYIGGKGDAGISYFEVVNDAPYLHFLSEYRGKEPQKGLCFLPKTSCNTKKCEIAICYRLLKESVVPTSFQVPRKAEIFQKDLYPDTYAGVSALSSSDWFEGKNANPILRSMDPKESGKEDAAAGAAQAEVVFQKSRGDLEAELEKAHARIAELEAEVAALKK
jgi:coronin-1B/1C/6